MKSKIMSYVAKWEQQGYPNGIPDEADPRLEVLGKAPSWRWICRSIMRHDVALKDLGFARPKCEYYNMIKRAEIAARNVNKGETSDG
jgi:predicted phosphoadenosine phosphosulfate sulfurtransferase